MLQHIIFLCFTVLNFVLIQLNYENKEKIL